MAQAWTDNATVAVLSEQEAFLVRAVLEDAAPFLSPTYQDVAAEILSELNALVPEHVASAASVDGDTVIWGS